MTVRQTRSMADCGQLANVQSLLGRLPLTEQERANHLGRARQLTRRDLDRFVRMLRLYVKDVNDRE